MSSTARASRIVAHLDMDAFYASVELLRRPHLRGMAVVIGGRRAGSGTEPQRLGDYAGRGVVTTATYEARAFGVHSGMGLMKAAALAPHALLLPADFDEYRRLSHLFKSAVAELAPAIEDRGIDEIYIDLSNLPGVHEPVGHDPLGGLRAIAQDIKNNVRQRTGGLGCSIGLAPNKLLAKLASEFDKPDGLTLLLRPEDVPARVWPLPVRDINGIGPKAAARLAGMGIRSVGDLARHEPAALVEAFGRSYGAWLHAAAHGHDDRPVVTHSEPVSVSRETTFERDLHPRQDRDALSAILVHLCERVADDLHGKGYRARTVGIKLRFDDFRTVTRDLTLAEPTDTAEALLRAARDCLRRVTLSRRLRLLGVRTAALVRPAMPGEAPPPVPDATPAALPARSVATRARTAPPPGRDGTTRSLFDDEEGPG